MDRLEKSGIYVALALFFSCINYWSDTSHAKCTVTMFSWGEKLDMSYDQVFLLTFLEEAVWLIVSG